MHYIYCTQFALHCCTSDCQVLFTLCERAQPSCPEKMESGIWLKSRPKSKIASESDCGFPPQYPQDSHNLRERNTVVSQREILFINWDKYSHRGVSDWHYDFAHVFQLPLLDGVLFGLIEHLTLTVSHYYINTRDTKDTFAIVNSHWSFQISTQLQCTDATF